MPRIGNAAAIAVAVTIAGAPDAPVRAQSVVCAENLLESMRSAYGIPALGVAVTRGDTVVFNMTRGAAHLEFGVPATPSTLFQLSSTTRVFTSVLAMRMAELGQLDLDAPVTSYLSGAPTAWSGVTLRHLLANTSGLRDLAAEGADPATGESPALSLEDVYAGAGTPDPGARWGYNITDYMVIQAIVERVGGAPLPEVMRRLVFEPAGMTSARYWRSSREVVIGAATDYYPDSTSTPRRHEHRVFLFPQHLLAAGGATASVEDLIRFDRALGSGHLLPAGAREMMWQDTRLRDERTVSYGLGWDTKTHARGHRSAGHSGGFLTTFRVYPGSDITAIVLTNGFLHPMNVDDIATAFAAIWDPAIIGFSEPACALEQLSDAQF